MANAEPINVEVAYATPDDQLLLAMELPAGATVERAIRYSGILDRFPEIDLSRDKVGVFGKTCALDRVLAGGDRVEIYRELIADPKEVKQRKAAEKAAGE